MSNIAIITARGGSKRIPKKNIKTFCGKPIIAYSIESALGAAIFDEVMVSTDSKEIAKIAKKYGAKVPFMRSEQTSNDYATTNDVLKEVLWCYKNNGYFFDYMCCIYPPAPFVTGEKLKKAFDMLCNSKADCVMPVTTFSFPPLRGQIINAEGFLKYKWPENQNKRSQDLDAIFHDAGQFYFYKASVIYEGIKPTEIKTKPIVVSDLEVQDIDNLEDWEIAEMKYKLMIGK